MKTQFLDLWFTQTKSIAVLSVTVIKHLPLTMARPRTSLFHLQRCPYGMNDIYVYVFPIKQISYMKPSSHRYLRFRNYVSIIKKFSNVMSGFGGLEVSVWAFGTRVRGFKPDRSRRIFRAKKSSARLPSEGK